ncbi:DUF4169 family protein [Nitratireductor sp. CH_MIT9313-5]|uniref:DUF4169 family protein n=1 Tax=Nitratireductor sp. CH_MIT9313-5 TaxID=3107764 RepID=UPI00300B08C1
MADVVNLRVARKRKERALREEKAQENRIRYGRSKSEREIREKAAAREETHLEGHRLSRRDDD